MSLTVNRNQSGALVTYNREQEEIIRDIICRGLSNDEVAVFLHMCKRSGLDPIAKQIYPVKRWDSKLGREVMIIQTGIDGFRLIADRSHKYCPGRSPTFTYDKNGHLESATAYVKKQTHDGTWHEIEATAYYSEFVQTFKDKQTGQMVPTQFWAKMPRNQLAKCAESLLLRKCFPSELSGIYTKEEMDQSVDVKPLYNDINRRAKSVPAIEESPKITISKAQADELEALCEAAEPEAARICWSRILKLIPDCESWADVTPELYEKAKAYLIDKAITMPVMKEEPKEEVAE